MDVRFTNLTEEQAQSLVTWFVCSGEQYFSNACHERGEQSAMSDPMKTFTDGKANRDETGALVVVMQQLEDEDE